MERNYYLIHLVLLISVVRVLTLTTSECVDCKDFYPDEFLDLALACRSPIIPVFAPYLNTHPYLLHPLKVFYFGRIDLPTSILRC
jgi:hypothetical protein